MDYKLIFIVFRDSSLFGITALVSKNLSEILPQWGNIRGIIKY